jgi:hypothetical protein
MKELLESATTPPRHERYLSYTPASEVRFAADSGRFNMTQVGNNLGTITAEYPNIP